MISNHDVKDDKNLTSIEFDPIYSLQKVFSVGSNALIGKRIFNLVHLKNTDFFLIKKGTLIYAQEIFLYFD